MKTGTKNLFIGLGIAAGAFFTVRALMGRSGKKIREAITSRLSTKEQPRDPEGELYQ